MKFSDLVRTLQEILVTDKFITATLPDEVNKVTTYDIDDYRLLVRELGKREIKFFTYQLKVDRAFKIVIRNVHHSIPARNIKQALSELRFNCHNVVNIFTIGTLKNHCKILIKNPTLSTTRLPTILQRKVPYHQRQHPPATSIKYVADQLRSCSTNAR